MIDEITIKGFKRFAHQTFRIAPLTILTGLNGSGKTTVLHSLLLMSAASRASAKTVQLNGPFGLELGTFDDIQNWETPGSVSFTAKNGDGTTSSWKFYGEPSDLYASLEVNLPDRPLAFAPDGRCFQYLSAERLGPRNAMSSAAVPPDVMDVGYRGEYSAQVLYSLGSNLVDSARRCPPNFDGAALVKIETELWLSRIVRPVQIDAEWMPGTAMAGIKFRTGQDWVRPPNMGFGLTYCLPIILAGITATKGGLLIIENPEAHLHPSGQSKMGQFLATIAAAGVQVIVETHSDHFLNGVRRAIGEDSTIDRSDAIVHFFDIDDSSPKALEFNEIGGLTEWPNGFFDQYQLDVAALSRIRRKR